MSNDNFNSIFFAAPGEGGSLLLHVGDLTAHTMQFGMIGKGKSSLLEQEAIRRGLSYQELLQAMEPTQEEKERIDMIQQEETQREELRLQAVRDAYWSGSDQRKHEFSAIYDGLVNFCRLESPTLEQSKAVFDMLPLSIIGGGIRWGFDDSEVRDDIYSFIETNADRINAEISKK
jgi:hypothetical protein